ncbi:MAG: hypothetical protein ACYDIE_05350, partial [Candidatus Krumholzibacteriia bacterium]
MNRRRLLAVVWLIAAVAGPPAAHGQWSAADSTVAPPPVPGAADAGRADELTPEREELEGAEALLGRADLADLAALSDTAAGSAAAAGRRTSPGGAGAPPRWRLSWRGGAPGTTAGVAVRLEGRQGPVRLLVRRPAAATGEVVWGGGLVLRGGAGQLIGGTLGCAHGLGLLAAGGGRATTAAANVSLASVRPGVRLLSAGASEGSLRGVSAGFAAGRWGLTGVMGSLPTGTDAAPGARGRSFTLARLAYGVPRGEAALLVCAGRQEEGASLAACGRGAGVWYAAEAAAWRAAGGGTAELAWAAAAGARRRGWLIELQAAAADAGRGPRLGRPPPCLRGWNGCGWCLRTATALGPRARTEALFAVAREREEVAAGGVASG